MEAIYEGKAKKLFVTDDGLIQYFKDSATAFNGKKYAEFDGKGRLNNRISSLFFRALADRDVPSHFKRWLNDREMLVERLEIIPLEVVVRNQVAGSLIARTGLEKGTRFAEPIVEMYYKRDELDDPLLNRSHIRALGLATEQELRTCEQIALTVNRVLCDMLAEVGVGLADFKLEFGRDARGNVLLGDEITPDTCRLWDLETGRSLDKDVFRKDLGDLIETYEEVYGRLRERFPQYDIVEEAA